MAPSALVDDFVLTLSDNDESQISDAELIADVDFSSKSNKKRKRPSENTKVSNATKKQKKDGKSPVAAQTYHSEDSSEDEEEFGVQDGAIDPDFEFDMGANTFSEVRDDFDGWEETKTSKPEKNNSSKKTVDIDDIIAKRIAKNSGKKTRQEDEEVEPTADDDESQEDDQDDDDDDNEEQAENRDFPNFDDDELLAPDTFGADAEMEDEENDDASDDNTEDEDGSEDGRSSDSDSVASPTAHPDDLASDQSDAESQSSVSDEEEQARRRAFFAPEDKTKSSLLNDAASSFQQFSLSRPILRALAALSFHTPTPIQTRTIPIALQGLDVVGSAVTGSGKTAAFLLPILERLLYRTRKVPTTRVVILMPTRELAVQCHNVATALARFTDITFAQIVGGFSLREQEAILKKRPDVVIATPGRFIDHMRNSASFTIENIEILVLDEADRMLETGFEDELDEILKTIPKGRQTMLFSATMTDSVDKLVRVGMNRPVRLSVDAKKSTTAGLTQEFVRLRPGREKMRLATLCLLCTKVFTERTIVFFRQKKEAHRIRIVFGLLGLKAGELHGSMTQEQRIKAVNDFRDGRTTHLLATDLASRGLDIKNVMSVVNYEAPQTHEIYLHRVGRTARAGRSGRSCTIAAEQDRKVVKAAVKSGRQHGAKIVSRLMDTQEVDTMEEQISAFSDDIEEILKEEKEEKNMVQAEVELTKGENLVKHEAEIMARPKRTWFESEKDKRTAKQKGLAELNGLELKVKGEKKKLSNKDKKRLDDKRERLEGKIWRKGKGSEAAMKVGKGDRNKQSKSKSKPNGGASFKKAKSRR